MTGSAFRELLAGRRSVRRFKEEPVPAELIRELIEAATLAPSASNRQNWLFSVVVSAAVKQDMAECARQHWEQALARPEMASVGERVQEYQRNFYWFASAPVVLVISAKGPELFMTEMFGADADCVAGTVASAAMAAENLMLAAHASGLGSCCLTAPLAAEGELKRLLGLGMRQRIVCMVALGYADEEPECTPRRDVDSVMRYVE